MSGLRTVLPVILLALILGTLFAFPLGGRQQLSVEVWLITASAWLGWLITRRTLAAAPLVEGRLLSLLQFRRKPVQRARPRPRELVALEGTIVGARDHHRAYAHRLRPRLQQVAGHCLLSNYGVDMVKAPAEAAAVLGKSAWLIDGDVTGRSPSLAEIEELLDLLDGGPEA